MSALGVSRRSGSGERGAAASATERAAAGATASRFHHVHHVVSNKGVFDFETPDHAMRIWSLHPGVTVEQRIEELKNQLFADGFCTPALRITLKPFQILD